jgi:hypothetical protein
LLKELGKSEKFMELSDGFKRVFSDASREHKIILPIVGYSGHQRSTRADNTYSKSFRSEAIQAESNKQKLRR